MEHARKNRGPGSRRTGSNPSMTQQHACSKYQSYLWMKEKTVGWSIGEPSLVPEHDPPAINVSALLEED